MSVYDGLIKTIATTDHPLIRLVPTIVSLDEGALVKIVNPIAAAPNIVKRGSWPIGKAGIEESV